MDPLEGIRYPRTAEGVDVDANAGHLNELPVASEHVALELVEPEVPSTTAEAADDPDRASSSGADVRGATLLLCPGVGPDGPAGNPAAGGHDPGSTDIVHVDRHAAVTIDVLPTTLAFDPARNDVVRRAKDLGRAD